VLNRGLNVLVLATVVCTTLQTTGDASTVTQPRISGSQCNYDPNARPYTDPSGITYLCVKSGTSGIWLRVDSTTTTTISARASSLRKLVGTSCSRANATRSSAGVKLRCVRLGRSLRWMMIATRTPRTTVVPSATRFGLPLARAATDRPGPNMWDVKVVYATFRGGPDSSRDTNGQLATVASGIAGYFARQRPGYDLRFDTYDGRLDVLHLPLSQTADQFRKLFTDEGREVEDFLRSELRRAGLPIEFSIFGKGTYGSEKRIYLMFMEGPRGKKFGSDGIGVEYECGRVSELEAGGRLVGVNLRRNDGSPCEKVLAFESTGDFWNVGWDAVRFLATSLAELPECDSVTRAEIAKPVSQRVENTVSISDVRSNEWRLPTSQAGEPIMDATNSLYFKITKGPFVRDRCRDAAYSPFWQAAKPEAITEPITGVRSTVDRPDDSALPQAKFFYIVPKGGVDRSLDLRLDDAASTANTWLRSQTGKTLRWDTYDGKIDAQFVQLSLTEPELWSAEKGEEACHVGLCPSPDRLAKILISQGLLTGQKLAIILYEGSLSPVNPEISGCYAANSHVVLYATPGRSCLSMPFRTDIKTTSTSTLGLRILHEVFHTLGAVGGGAPNGDGMYGHIRGNSNDLMAIGSRTAWEVDPGRDDYWGHGQAGRTDLSKSIFFDPIAPGAALPERWLRP
jgi:hypothetical protein